MYLLLLTARRRFRRYYPLTWKEWLLVPFLVAGYFGMMKLLERRFPSWEDWQIRIVTGIVLVIVGLIVFSLFDF